MGWVGLSSPDPGGGRYRLQAAMPEAATMAAISAHPGRPILLGRRVDFMAFASRLQLCAAGTEA